MTLHWLLSSAAAVNPVHAPVTAGQTGIYLDVIQGRKDLSLGLHVYMYLADDGYGLYCHLIVLWIQHQK